MAYISKVYEDFGDSVFKNTVYQRYLPYSSVNVTDPVYYPDRTGQTESK